MSLLWGLMMVIMMAIVVWGWDMFDGCGKEVELVCIAVVGVVVVVVVGVEIMVEMWFGVDGCHGLCSMVVVSGVVNM